MKVAFIDSGLFQKQAFASLGRRFEAIPSCRLAAISLVSYDVIIVPTQTSEDALLAAMPSFSEFLRWGGVLLVLGFKTYGASFLPPLAFHAWVIELTHSALDSDAAKDVFGETVSAESSFVHAHGYLDNLPPGSMVLSANSLKRAHTVAIRRQSEGTILVTTLDPDYHIVSPETTLAARDNCRSLVLNMIRWAEHEAMSKSVPALASMKSWVARLTGSKMRLRFAMLGVVAVTVGASLYIFITNPEAGTASAISSASSIASLVLAVLMMRNL